MAGVSKSEIPEENLNPKKAPTAALDALPAASPLLSSLLPRFHMTRPPCCHSIMPATSIAPPPPPAKEEARMYGIFLGFGLMATETVRHPVVLGRRRESPATPHAAAAAWTSLHLLRATHTTRPRLAPSSQAIVILFILAQCCCSAAEEEHKRDAKLLDEDRLTSSAYPPAGGNSCTDTSSHQQLHWRLSTLHGAPAGLRCGWGGSRACIHTSACGLYLTVRFL